MSDILIALGAITLLALMAVGSTIVGNLVAKFVFWMWDRR